MNHVARLTHHLTELIAETNGLALLDTLDLALKSARVEADPEVWESIRSFHTALNDFRINRASIDTLLSHPLSEALTSILGAFPLPYREEHTHLTGSLAPEFVFPYLEALLAGPRQAEYEKKIKEVYGPNSFPIRDVSDVERLLRLGTEDRFDRYLKILYLPKLILTSRDAHRAAAYHLASRLYRKYNVGFLRLKFTLFRETSESSEQIPGLETLNPEDIVLGLYDGFKSFQSECPGFRFILAPSFRKEPGFFDSLRFSSKKDHFTEQVRQIIELLTRFPELSEHLCEVDTVGDERGFHRKVHFQQMRVGLQKLQAFGFAIRSHHGETWSTLRQGIQAVDNAMNIWHVDAIEHGLSLGVNPNHYFHTMLQHLFRQNSRGEAVPIGSPAHNELMEIDWDGREAITPKLLAGVELTEAERTRLIKAKFYTAREAEHYQHDVLNRMIAKGLSLIALPSSNKRLTGAFDDYKDHPFSWWEKKGIKLGVGTDNYITLNTNYLREMLILLYTDPQDLKITKLLMVTTGESRRPHISHLLWKMRKRLQSIS
ncbi:MAG: hypothetical protein A2289_13270 [Deltaproteobacteria bacterium RIFOXYA12_FULL_58_15]|nr:MAG: hypothetical protein A2289_13270 [Deltaproteobacteria bacterium RIFOXYA12_FULL_58_15]OGR13823.1 MAG: hypothetical protein A2341_01380 [Deltaproteobacteria bacterium RIFOXYB12_FULL_58_9]